MARAPQAAAAAKQVNRGAVAAPKTEDVPKGESKSIINPKYRDKYKTPDWLGGVINGLSNKMVEVEKKIKDENGKEKTIKTKKPEGVNVDTLIALATENKCDEKSIARIEAAKGTNGAEGRARMTIRNMLQSVAKRRHGLLINGKFVSAPAEWLTEKQAPADPTEKRDGTPIKKE